MRKVVLFLISILCLGVFSVNAQKHRDRKKKGAYEPTAAQIMSFKEGYKKMLGDSLHIPVEKRDTVASIEVDFLLKKMKLDGDRSVAKDDKEIQTGMMEEDMYMRLGAILNPDELGRLRAFSERQKQEQKDREKARQEQQNNSNNTYGRQYGGYGGYGGYRGY